MSPGQAYVTELRRAIHEGKSKDDCRWMATDAADRAHAAKRRRLQPKSKVCDCGKVHDRHGRLCWDCEDGKRRNGRRRARIRARRLEGLAETR